MDDGIIEDRGILRQTRDREMFDIAFKRAGIEKLPRNVVEPDALPSRLWSISIAFMISPPGPCSHAQSCALSVLPSLESCTYSVPR
jgi:hypothetical protein